MDTFNLTKDIRVFGFEVSGGADGIGEAFNHLVDRVGGNFRRQYYGLSQMKAGCFSYTAAAEATFKGEGSQYGFQEFEIEKGEYLAVTIRDWRKKTESIKDVFQEIVMDERVDCSKPLVEWYKDDDEMICMARVQSRENLREQHG